MGLIFFKELKYMKIIDWLLEGDAAIAYQTYRDLLDDNRLDLKVKISEEGFGKRLMEFQQPNGHWGGGYYSKKWTSTHYTLMELRRLNINPSPQIKKAIDNILDSHILNSDGSKPEKHTWIINDICMYGMLLHAFAYFKVDERKLVSTIDFILARQLPDGGYNCEFGRSSKIVRHSSLHSTISIIEGMTTYLDNGYVYRKNEIIKQRQEAVEFILMHRLFKSDKTGLIIKKSFLMLSYPPRWKYDILRALDAFREAKVPYDMRMDEAIEVLMKKRRIDGTWPVQQKYQGLVHFDMEPTGGPSRMNTLRVLRVLKYYRPDIYERLDL